MANQKALIDAITLLADGAKDFSQAIQGNQSFIQKLEDFENLISDGIAEAGDGGISEIKAEIASLQPADYVSLTGVLVADLGFSQPKAQAICAASLKLLGDEIPSIADVKALIAAAK